MSAPAPTTSASPAVEAPAAAPDATLTSKDYYFDSYAHFGKSFFILKQYKLNLI